MRWLRNLLIGFVAGFMAIVGAQAADMPLKAKPVEYVKICSLYGAGFYYLPGTDICVKWGAYVRFQPFYAHGSSPTNGPFQGAAAQATNFIGTQNDLVMRSRGIYTMDARTQTEYGTLRSYILIGFEENTPSNQPGASGATLFARRGFIQFAGFTLGKATSFYEVFSNSANSYYSLNTPDTGSSGDLVAAYTYQFGNGFSATISAEDPRRASVVNTSISGGNAAVPCAAVPIGGFGGNACANPFTVGAVPTADQAQIRWPDIVANLRVDQAWGSLQLMGALHDTTGGYFVPSVGVTCNIGAFGGTLTGQLACGHPSDELGFAVGAGGVLKIPMPTGLTDIASFQVTYTEGAIRYVDFSRPGSGSPDFFSSTGLATCPSAPVPANSAANGLNTPTCLGSLGIGYYTDAVYANPGTLLGYNGSVQTTRAWGVAAAWDHSWTPDLKTSVYGTLNQFDYNATAEQLISLATCGTSGTAANTVTRMTNVAGPPGITGAGVRFLSCSPDFSIWQIGSRTQWNITSSFYVGFDVKYQKLETAFAGNAFFLAATGLPRPSGDYQIKDQDIVSFTARAQWNILP